MIEKAKQKGADGIIFFDTIVNREDEETGDRISVQAKIIQYLN